MSQTLVTTIWSNPQGNYMIEFWANDDGTYDIYKKHLNKDTVKIIGQNLHKLLAHLTFKSLYKTGTVERSV